MITQVPTLEKFVKDDDIKELTESTQILTTSQQEFPKPKPNLEIVEEKKIIKENDNTINDDIKEANLNKIMREEGQLQIKGRKGSNYFSLSQNFLQQYDAIEIPNLKLNKDNKKKLEDLSLGKNLINDEENKDIENIKNMFGNQKEESNPILLAPSNNMFKNKI